MSVRCAYSLFLLRLVIDDAVADFLNIRKIPLQRFEYPSQGDSTLEQEAAAVRDEMRQVILKDRDLHDRGIKAFVSSIRSYSKHEASYLFRLQDLDLVGLAQSFALLRMPKVAELKGKEKEIRERWEDVEVDWDSYAYADKVREKQRKAELKVQQEKRLEQESRKRALAESNAASAVD
ncbi:ATP-dependent rRNA helicase spb4, partial [Rhodotorula toruloides]